jgi:hypothetical protein
MNHLERAAVAAAALFGACSAFAGSAAEVRFDVLTVTLVDLNPADGIVPTIGFAGGASRASAVLFQPFGVYDEDVGNGGSAWGDVDVSVTLSLGHVEASLTGAGVDGSGATVHVAGQAAEPGGPLGASVQYQAQVWAPYQSAGAFVLSPWTSVTFSVQANLSAITQSSGTSHDYAVAGAYLFLNGTGDAATLECESLAGRQCSAGDVRQLSVSFANSAGTSVDGTFQAWAQAAGYSQAVGVPEPATPLLLLGGLGVLGSVARRRRGPRVPPPRVR